MVGSRFKRAEEARGEKQQSPKGSCSAEYRPTSPPAAHRPHRKGEAFDATEDEAVDRADEAYSPGVVRVLLMGSNRPVPARRHTRKRSRPLVQTGSPVIVRECRWVARTFRCAPHCDRLRDGRLPLRQRRQSPVARARAVGQPAPSVTKAYRKRVSRCPVNFAKACGVLEPDQTRHRVCNRSVPAIYVAVGVVEARRVGLTKSEVTGLTRLGKQHPIGDIHANTGDGTHAPVASSAPLSLALLWTTSTPLSIIGAALSPIKHDQQLQICDLASHCGPAAGDSPP